MIKEKRDETTALRSLEDLDKFKGVKGVYILYQPITKFIKVGRSYNISKRYDALNEIMTPHILIAFYPTNDYKLIEKLFHKQHRKYQISMEYFNLSPDYAIDWMSANGLKSSYSTSLKEMTFQLIRANWIIKISSGNFLPFKEYLKNTIGYASR